LWRGRGGGDGGARGGFKKVADNQTAAVGIHQTPRTHIPRRKEKKNGARQPMAAGNNEGRKKCTESGECWGSGGGGKERESHVNARPVFTGGRQKGGDEKRGMGEVALTKKMVEGRSGGGGWVTGGETGTKEGWAYLPSSPIQKR